MKVSHHIIYKKAFFQQCRLIARKIDKISKFKIFDMSTTQENATLPGAVPIANHSLNDDYVTQSVEQTDSRFAVAQLGQPLLASFPYRSETNVAVASREGPIPERQFISETRIDAIQEEIQKTDKKIKEIVEQLDKLLATIMQLEDKLKTEIQQKCEKTGENIGILDKRSKTNSENIGILDKRSERNSEQIAILYKMIRELG